MNTLRRDELFLLAVDLSLPDLLNFCTTSREINKIICNNDNFWLYKLNKEFPLWNTNENELLKDPKSLKTLQELQTYKEKYLLFSNLKSFQILKDKLKISEDIYQIFTLKELTLGHRGIAEIPKEIGMLTNLETLYLGGNKITEIPKEIGKLHNLRILGLSDNEILKIPKEIGKLTNLISIQLQDSPISTIPVEIGDLKNLKYLYLSETRISRHSPEITKLKKKLPKLNIYF